MDALDVLKDAFGRIAEEVSGLLDGADEQELVWRAGPEANTVAWLVWHLTRVQDDHVAEAAGRDQIWHSTGWRDRFHLPLGPDDTGYGHSSDQVAQVRAPAELLSGYFDDVHRATMSYLGGLSDTDLDRVVDRRWDPPVTLGVRLVSVVGDDMQHIGQAALVRGLYRQRHS